MLGELATMLVGLLLHGARSRAVSPGTALSRNRARDISVGYCNCRASANRASFQINNLLDSQVIFAVESSGKRVKIVCGKRHMDAA
jgi:hypothetical protein